MTVLFNEANQMASQQWALLSLVYMMVFLLLFDFRHERNRVYRWLCWWYRCNNAAYDLDL